ncbi:MAG TPA: hypothetical protein VFK81_04915 [Terriglobales bacterium]|nr:hypothetical protein [Terriglobales bacterium]
MQHRQTPLVVLMVVCFAGWLSAAQNSSSPKQNNSADQKNAQSNPSEKVPEISGNLGGCSVEIHVIDSAGKPVYGAQVSVHIRYGFGGFHRLDLQIGTNTDGLARFVGLTERARMPLSFYADYHGRETVVPVDLRQNCHQKQDAAIPDKPAPPPQD